MNYKQHCIFPGENLGNRLHSYKVITLEENLLHIHHMKLFTSAYIRTSCLRPELEDLKITCSSSHLPAWAHIVGSKPSLRVGSCISLSKYFRNKFYNGQGYWRSRKWTRQLFILLHPPLVISSVHFFHCLPLLPLSFSPFPHPSLLLNSHFLPSYPITSIYPSVEKQS